MWKPAGTRQNHTKLHVGNISPVCTNQEPGAEFEKYGPAIECDVVKDCAFVHTERAEVIRALDNTEFQGQRMHVKLSTSHSGLRPETRAVVIGAGKWGTSPKSDP